MTLEPLLQASLAIQLHAYSAILAFLLGGFVLFRPKGTAAHRLAGRLWAGLMLVTAGSSFFIHISQIFGIWSPIHLLSVATLWFLVQGVRAARAGRIVEHRRVMQSLYLGALVLAGFFTFMPGRIMYRVFFGGPEPLVGVAVAALLAAMTAALMWQVFAAPARRLLSRG